MSAAADIVPALPPYDLAAGRFTSRPHTPAEMIGIIQAAASAPETVRCFYNVRPDKRDADGMAKVPASEIKPISGAAGLSFENHRYFVVQPRELSLVLFSDFLGKVESRERGQNARLAIPGEHTPEYCAFRENAATMLDAVNKLLEPMRGAYKVPANLSDNDRLAINAFLRANGMPDCTRWNGGAGGEA